MALISRFVEVSSEMKRVHTEVTCGYHVVGAKGGRYLQLDTYGSDERVMPGKVSQSIQLDHAAARRLKELIEQTFPGI